MFSKTLIDRKQAMQHGALLMLVTLATPDFAFSQLYNVVPRDLGGGYEIADGGTITVAAGAITEWDISVVGDVPYTFSHTKPGAVVNAEEIVNITPSAITVSLDRAGDGVLNFDARDSVDSQCPVGFTCEQGLSWVDQGPFLGTPARSFLFYDYLGFDSEGRGSLNESATLPLPTGEFLVATVVPEPSVFTMGWVAWLCGLAARRRKIP